MSLSVMYMWQWTELTDWVKDMRSKCAIIQPDTYSLAVSETRVRYKGQELRSVKAAPNVLHVKRKYAKVLQ